MQSWYAQKGVTPLPRGKPTAGSVYQSQMLRGNRFGFPSMTVANIHASMHTPNVNNVKGNQYQTSNMSNNASKPYAQSNAGIPKFQRHRGHVDAPTAVVQCTEQHVPMSQLTSSFDLSGSTSQYSQVQERPQSGPTRLFQNGSNTNQGIPPFTAIRQHTNHHPTDVTATSQQGWSSNINELSQPSVSTRGSMNPYFKKPPMQSADLYSNHASQSGQSVHVSHYNSQDTGTSEDSRFHGKAMSIDSSNSGIPQFHKNVHRLSQSSHSASSVPSNERHIQDEGRLQAVIDKLKEFDERQLLFHRRISEAEEKHMECINEVDRKHKECMQQLKECNEKQSSFYHRITESEDKYEENYKIIERKHKECIKQIQDLGKRSEELNVQISDASNSLSTYTKDLEKKTDELHSKGEYIDTMYTKVTTMLKAVEFSTSTLKELAKSSISTMKQTNESVKETAKDIVLSILSSFGFAQNGSTNVSQTELKSQSSTESQDDFPVMIDKAELKSKPSAESQDDFLVMTDKAQCAADKHVAKNKKGACDEIMSDSVVMQQNKQTFDHKDKSSIHPKSPSKKHKNGIPFEITTGMGVVGENGNKFSYSPTKTSKSLRLSKVNHRSKKRTHDENNRRQTTKMSKAETARPQYEAIRSSNTLPQQLTLVSPFASSVSSSAGQSIHSMATPNHGSQELQTPSRKRTIPVKNVQVKRGRSRYGRMTRTYLNDDDKEFSFLSSN